MRGTLYVTRHGETDANREQRVQGQGDNPLNAEGLEQARELARFFAGKAVDAIVSSDLVRARQTAQVLSQTLGVSVRFHPELRARRMGDYEGRTHAELAAADPESFRRLKHDPAFIPPGGGESVEDLRARALPFVRRLAAENPGRALVILSHHKVCQLLIADLAGGGRAGAIPNARPARVTYEGGAFRLETEEGRFHGAA